jgi:5-oxoprolinase (ATP-hydrolysing)
MTVGRWEFWIDVGGTFTDCIARSADGVLRRHKLLSTGVTKGSVGLRSSSELIFDAARCSDPQHFWRGAKLSLFGQDGNVVADATVAEFDAAAGAMQLDRPLSVTPAIGQAYELSTGEEAPVVGVCYLLGLPAGAPLAPVAVRLGTTRGTNALLTRRGARTAFITTRGFGDILHIGYQNRPKLFELNIRKPAPLFDAVVEIDERVSASGEVLLAPDREVVRHQLAELRLKNVESLAICLLHSTEYPAHEHFVAVIAREVGFEEISVSHEVAPLVKIVPRGDTTVLDAYLNPVLRRYIAGLQTAMPQCDLRILTSAGGLAASARFSGKDSLLSGPAGGVVGFSRVAQAAGFERAIGFDMGGTSTDVSRFDGRYEMQYETEKAGVRVAAPMLAIETVAAGGGSICSFDGVKLVVGPDSAGANPGPACYGRGGPLAVTDLNFYLGKIQADRFPFPLDRVAVETRLAALADRVAQATGVRYALIELAESLLQIANANMVKAIRSVSIAKGCDPRDYVLVPFGGAAGQHACAIAAELDIGEILHHPDAGLLSAYGIGLADHTRHRSASVARRYSAEAIREMRDVFARLEADARAELAVDFTAAETELPRSTVVRRLDLRYQGLDAYLTIDQPTSGDWAAAFAAEHRKLYGYAHHGRTLEIVAARVEVRHKSRQQLPSSTRVSLPEEARQPPPDKIVTAYFNTKSHETRVYDRDHLKAGSTIAGPAIIHESASTTVIDPGWQGEVLSGAEILVTADGPVGWSLRSSVSAAAPKGPQNGHKAELQQPDPARLEIFNNHFAAIAEQMGITLRNTAASVNVKERLDFSCAIFTARGELVVNAPHIPVHLGAMGETVRRILADNPEISPGDVFITNDPYAGGSHLPDVTVVTPVFSSAEWGIRNSESGKAAVGEHDLLFFTGNRAHHAEIGGITPGSMPPFSQNLAEEGVVIRNMKLVEAGQQRLDRLRDVLLAGPYPTRAIDDNLADISAQVAANHQGARDLVAMVDRFTLPVVQAYMRHIQTAAEMKLRQALAKLPPGRREFIDHLDDAAPIKVAITVHEGRRTELIPFYTALTIDFTGTGPVHAGNLNANRAIVTAAVMYVLRLLIDEDIPLNEGVLAPVELILPECFLNPPAHELPEQCAAVVGGNVETSQRVVDVLLGALGLAAASQGTMNNLLFGDSQFGYYETVCGGAGATANADGADAVHTHMTNTRLTDPEVLERRYPVRLHEFAIRRGSGGAGRHHGGSGVVRRLEFLRPLEVSILSQRRETYPPYGLAGGSPGALGRNTLTRSSGQIEHLPGLAHIHVQPGHILTIETPGGGGWGVTG